MSRNANLISMLCLLAALSWGNAKAQNNVPPGGELATFSTTDLSTSSSWTTDRSATPGYFSCVENGSFSGAAANANVDGYIKYYSGSLSNASFTFPVGNGSTLHNVTVSGIAPGAQVATAWIDGNPGTVPDPTSTGAAGGLQDTSLVGGGLSAVSGSGRWDWQDISGTLSGTTITVTIPDLTSFATSASALRLAGWNGSSWVNLTGNTGNGTGLTSGNTLSGTMINGISAIGVAKSSGIKVSPKIFLSGAYNTGTGIMSTSLLTSGVIPLAQPYNTAPFSYAGSETVNAIPANVTDWVLVELRNATTPATVVATRAAFVLKNGSVVDTDGVSPVSFSNAEPGNYYLAIRHRMHLGIRTAAPVTLTTSPYTYDFTSAQSQAYQNSSVTTNTAMKNMGNGVFALWGGNGSVTGTGATTVRATGAPTVNDYSVLLMLLNGQVQVGPIYSGMDYNMNGTVRVTGTPQVNDYTFLLNVLGATPVVTQHL